MFWLLVDRFVLLLATVLQDGLACESRLAYVWDNTVQNTSVTSCPRPHAWPNPDIYAPLWRRSPEQDIRNMLPCSPEASDGLAGSSAWSIDASFCRQRWAAELTGCRTPLLSHQTTRPAQGLCGVTMYASACWARF